MKNNRYIVIVGCGSLGSLLANRLSQEGHSVVVIDKENSTFENLSTSFSGFRLEGDATQVSILKKAKLSDADTFIATTREDNVNLMVAQIAHKVFNVPSVLARVFSPRWEKASTQLGIKIICTTSITAGIFLNAISDTDSI